MLNDDSCLSSKILSATCQGEVWNEICIDTSLQSPKCEKRTKKPSKKRYQSMIGTTFAWRFCFALLGNCLFCHCIGQKSCKPLWYTLLQITSVQPLIIRVVSVPNVCATFSHLVQSRLITISFCRNNTSKASSMRLFTLCSDEIFGYKSETPLGLITSRQCFRTLYQYG